MSTHSARPPSARALVKEMHRCADPKRVAFFARFFKVEASQYGEGDKFLGGFTAIAMRKLAYRYGTLALSEIAGLLASDFHEHRFVAAEILVYQYERGTQALKTKIFNFYVKHRRLVNNWDLVDTSVQYILGDYLRDKDKTLLYKLARSKKVFERRMAIIATFDFLRHGQFEDTLQIAEILLHDPHALLHKAVGWMLRELGKRSPALELQFLNAHAAEMPRTMLRYAIERFPEKQRLYYLNLKRK